MLTYPTSCLNRKKHAIVTLVMGSDTGYVSGAVALGQSLIDVESETRRVCMVTPDVPKPSREDLAKFWEVKVVEPVYCNHKHQLDPTKHNLEGERYKAGIKRWSKTCTKFRAWTLTEFKRIIFMDSDMLAVENFDDAFYGFSNASFVAAPETFPPDNFNSGFMVIRPSMEGFENLLQINEDVGSAEGGDQGVFNNGLCPNWFYAPSDDPDCGRLPWIFNIQAAHYDQYKTLRQMTGDRVPQTIHFVSDGKPWKVLTYEFLPNPEEIPGHMLIDIGKQANTHMLWRLAYFRANDMQPVNNVLIRAATIAQGLPDPYEEAAKERKKRALPGY